MKKKVIKTHRCAHCGKQLKYGLRCTCQPLENPDFYLPIYPRAKGFRYIEGELTEEITGFFTHKKKTNEAKK